jgi:hypothetical protein
MREKYFSLVLKFYFLTKKVRKEVIQRFDNYYFRVVEENFKMSIGKCIWIRNDKFCYFNWLDYRFDWRYFDVLWKDF